MARSVHSRRSPSTTAPSKWRKRRPNSRRPAGWFQSAAAAILLRRSMLPAWATALPTCRPQAARSWNGSRAKRYLLSKCYERRPATVKRSAPRQSEPDDEEDAMNLTELHKIACAMVAPGKGLLAADE